MRELRCAMSDDLATGLFPTRTQLESSYVDLFRRDVLVRPRERSG